MSFDIPQMHIPDNSPEAQAVELVMNSENVGAEEAVRTILRRARQTVPTTNYIKEGRGMFRDPEDAKILDEAVAIALEERHRPSKRTTD